MKKILMLLLISSNIFALTIDEAVESAINNNHLLKALKSETKSSQYETEAAKSLNMPSIFFDTSYTLLDDEKKLTVQMAPGISTSVTQVKDNYFDANVGVKYNIYSGGAISSNINIKRLREKATNENFLEFKNNLIFQVKKSYVETLKLIALKDIAISHYNALESHYNDIQKFYAQGLVAQIDLLQTNVKLKEAKQYLTKIESQINVAKSSLSMLIRDNIDSKDIEITEIKVFDYDDVTFNLQDLYEKAVNNRPVIKQLNTEIAALKESKNLIKSDFNPKIYVAAGYSYSNQNDDIEPKGGFFGKLGLNFDLQWNKPSKEISAVSEKIIALNQKRLNTILQIKLEVKDAFENYITARENLKVAKTALKEAEEYFRIVKLKYSNSLASNSDVLDAEAMLTSALNNEKNAYYDLIISYYQIEKTIGNNLR
ncbi:MAG: hypothetical protein PWQ25_316 [Deferribacteres bacterium]|jgi:outer membrane protein TolC|nr:outer rane efflux protein [Deferribacteraceae bacterium]MDK2791453.1 hypothetical protein [Deferribacteres bacterium]